MIYIHEILSAFLFYSCFCRSLKMSKETTILEIRLAFYCLAITSVVSIFAPLQGFEPNYLVVMLLSAISIVQYTTSKYWKSSPPIKFTKEYHGQN